MAKVKQLQMDIQYILNVLSSHGEEKAIQAFENVRNALAPMSEQGDCKHGLNVRDYDPVTHIPMYGDQIKTVGQLRHILRDLDDHDQLCIETINEDGDVEDLFPMYIDVIDGIRLTDDTIVREVRFCQMPNK